MNIEHTYHLWDRMITKIYTIALSPCFYSIGKKASIKPPFRYANLDQIVLGNNVTINSNCWIQSVRHKSTKKNIPKVIIGDHVSIGMNATISAAKNIIVEEYVFTARNVYISDHKHKYDDISMPISIQSIDNIADVRIGKYTWLGQNSVVMPGVTIGRHCIIGANAVVTKDVPDYSVVVGVPAKIIKQYDQNRKAWINI